jgi:hypothetical protein
MLGSKLMAAARFSAVVVSGTIGSEREWLSFHM